MTMIVKNSGILLLLSLTILKISSISAVQQANDTLSHNEREKTNRTDEKRGNKVIGGYRCPITKYPFLVSLRRRYFFTFSHYCAGSLLSNFWVLTAFHCVQDICHEPIKVVAGSSLMENTNNRVVQTSTILRCYLYPIKDTERYDIALAKLTKPMVETKFVGYAKLPFSLYGDNGTVKSPCTNSTVAGWGTQHPMNSSEIPSYLPVPQHDNRLRCVHLPIISPEECQSRIETKLSTSMLCTFHPMRDACFGDSGGPLMCDGYQFGIISFGYGCRFGGYAGVSVNITYFRQFILKTLRINEFTTRTKSTTNITCAVKLSAVLVIFTILKLYWFD